MTLNHLVNLTEKLVEAVLELSGPHQRVVVGIDGPDCAGKTTVADSLAVSLAGASQTPTVRVSVDGFHLPREQRYRRGELSPEGYYLDSFDYQGMRDECLLPFLGGAPRLRTTRYDHRADAADVIDAIDVPTKAVLLLDGVFLLRADLRDLWTLSVYLRVSPEETLRRAHRRDLGLFGSADEVRRRYLGRYLPGQALYRQRSDPEALAHILVDNEHGDAPRVERWTVPG